MKHGLSLVKKISLGILTSILFLFFCATFSYAAEDASSGIATYIQIVDKNVQEGDIISYSTTGYKRSTIPYDPAVFGIVVKDPAVAFETVNQADTHPVISSGKV